MKIREQLASKDYLCQQVMQARQYMEQQFAQSISLDTLAVRARIAKYHFIRVFKQYYGRTPYQYLTGVRIARAKQLLQAGMTVSDTCYSVGFDSIPSFTTLFKKMTGTTPARYRSKGFPAQKSNFQ